MTTPKVILLAGLPGSGKSVFAQWLRDRGWIIVESDPFYRGASTNTDLEEAWVPFLFGNGDSQQLQAQIAVSTSPILVEWGFSVTLLSTVVKLLRLGIEGWWFDGDLDACHTAWRQVHHSAKDEREWQLQVPSVQAEWPKIAAAFRHRIVRVVGPGPWRLPHEQIASLMGITSEPPPMTVDDTR